MNMTDEKMTDKVQAAVPADTVMQPEEKSKIVYEGGGIWYSGPLEIQGSL